MDKEKKGVVIWFTGLPSSGKTTLAIHLRKKLENNREKVYLLDGDQLRSGLNSDLGFLEKDRSENIRRAAEVAKLLADSGLIVLATFISPFEMDRVKACNIIGRDRFFLVFVDCELEVCELRDVKGLYKKARLGEIKNFTGIDGPYEKPLHPDIIINTAKLSLEECVSQLEIDILSQFKV
ncbi:MAG: adenylyl-sulfate kinase [Bacteroidota bacterium]